MIQCKFLLIALLLSYPAYANEDAVTKKWCGDLGGASHKVLKDGTEVDCLLDDYAVEVEWARNYKSGMGQAVHYARMTEKWPAIGLIMEPGDERYLDALVMDAGNVWYCAGDTCKRLLVFLIRK